MCFSATASFVASGGLAAAGVVSMREAVEPQQKLIAAIPFLFAIQQALEGWQWVALGGGSVSMAAGYSFLFFAFLFWPLYIPMTIYLLDKERRRVLWVFVAIGIALSAFFAAVMLHHPLTVQACDRSIVYILHIPFGNLSPLLYYATICGVLMLSSKRELRWFGVAVFVAAAISAYFYLATFTSVSCFFVALLSFLIFLYIRKQNRLTARRAAK